MELHWHESCICVESTFYFCFGEWACVGPSFFDVSLLSYLCIIIIIQAISTFGFLTNVSLMIWNSEEHHIFIYIVHFKLYIVISTLFDNTNNVAHPVSTKFYVIKDARWIVLWMCNNTNSFNSGLVAYKLNFLLMVVNITEPCWNTDWLCDNSITFKFLL